MNDFLPPGGVPPAGGPPPPGAAPPGFGSFPPMDPASLAALDHSRNTGPAIGVAAFCIVVTTTAVALRLYTRCFLLKRVAADDYMAVASLVGVLAVAGTLIEHTKHGLGSHLWDVAQDPQTLQDFFRHFYLGTVFYNITLLFIKLSLVLQYYPIVKQIPRYHTVFFAVASVVVAWTIGLVFTVILICVPARGYWDKSVPARCLPDQTVQLVNAVGNIVTDVMLLALPLPIVWRQRLAPRQKAVLTVIFCLGFFTVVISLLRLAFIFSPHKTFDITYDTVAISSWTLAEVTTGTLCAALITLRPLLSRVLPEFEFIRSALRAFTPGTSHKHEGYTMSDQATVKGRGEVYATKSLGVASPGPVSPGLAVPPRPFYASEAGPSHATSLVLVIQGTSQASLHTRQPSSGVETSGPQLSSYEDLADAGSYQQADDLHFDASELAGLEPAPESPKPTTSSTYCSSMHPSSEDRRTELRYPPIYHLREKKSD